MRLEEKPKAEDADEEKDDPSAEKAGEDEKKRRDRELIELLNELRVVLPGVQVLFAFLLTVPFSNGYSKMTGLQKDVYLISFLCAAAATILLIAPSTYHRIQFRRGDKERMLHTANWMVISGTVFLGVSMSSATFVISDVLFRVPIAAAIAAASAVPFAWLWYLLPLYRRHSERVRSGARGEESE